MQDIYGETALHLRRLSKKDSTTRARTLIIFYLEFYVSRLCAPWHICTNSSIWHLTQCFWSTLSYFSSCFECPKHSSLAPTSTCDQWNAHLPRALIYPNKLVREMSPFHVNVTKEWYIYIWALKSPLNGIILSTRYVRVTLGPYFMQKATY